MSWRKIRHASFWVTIATINMVAFQNCGPLAETTGSSVGASSPTAATHEPPAVQGPLIAMTAPIDGATLSGTITFATATGGPNAIAGVQLYFGTQPIEGEDQTEPFAITVATSNHPNGTYAVTAHARDFAGNVTVSDVLYVTIANGQTR